jgi:hypothetical protein
MVCSGCAEIATNVVLQNSMQYAQDQYLLANNQVVTKCNVFNVAKGNKLCRIHRHYRSVK